MWAMLFNWDYTGLVVADQGSAGVRGSALVAEDSAAQLPVPVADQS